MASGISGSLLVILIDGVAVGGERGNTINRPAEALDTSSKADYPHKTHDYSWLDSTVSVDGIYVPDDTAWVALLAARKDQTLVTLSEQEDSVVLRTAEAVITNLVKTSGQDDVITCSAEFQVSGGWSDE